MRQTRTTTLVGIKEIAEQLQVQPPTLSVWRFRGLLQDFPEPVAQISGRKVYEWRDVRQWAIRHGRLPRS